MKKVKLLTSFTDGSRHGDVVELSDEAAERYVARGVGEIVGAGKADAKPAATRASSKAATREKAVKRGGEKR